jgi:carbonic anhydrase/acetyltransferase-like protein (isoleucine patch superfamily)
MVIDVEVIKPGSLHLNNSFIDPTVIIDNPLIMEGEYIYVAPFVEFHSSKSDIRVGERTNIQDCAKIHGPSYIGSNVTIAHRAEIHNSTINDFAFIGFNTKIINSRVGRGAFVSHGAVIQGMNIEPDYYVPPGGREAQDKIDKEKKRFRDEVLEVNTELALGYMKLYDEIGAEIFSLVCPSPKTSWTKTYIYPEADKAHKIGMARIIGGVVFKGRAELGDRVSIRGDEGWPIIFGDGVTIGNGTVFHSLKGKAVDKVTISRGGGVFHSLKGAAIDIGNNVKIGESCVIHGPMVVGDGAIIEDGSILLECEIAKGQRVSPGSIIVPGT